MYQRLRAFIKDPSKEITVYENNGVKIVRYFGSSRMHLSWEKPLTLEQVKALCYDKIINRWDVKSSEVLNLMTRKYRDFAENERTYDKHYKEYYRILNSIPINYEKLQKYLNMNRFHGYELDTWEGL